MRDVLEMQVLRVSDSVRITETQDGAVLLDVDQGLCFSINPVGTLIWKRVNECCPIAQIVQYVVETFNIPLEQARTDTHEFLDVLLEKRLVLDNHKNAANSRRGWIAAIIPRLWKLVGFGRTRQQE